MPPAIAIPNVMADPGFLWISTLPTVEPTHASASGGKFTDTVPAAWLPLGATSDGSTLSYNSTVAPVRVAELLDPVKFFTTERGGSIAFNLANFTLSNYRRALNGGVAALTATGTSGQEVTRLGGPPTPGSEVRAQILWESSDGTMRFIAYQCLQGGEISTAFKKAPDIAVIPCTFNMEVPASGKPFDIIVAGTSRV